MQAPAGTDPKHNGTKAMGVGVGDHVGASLVDCERNVLPLLLGRAQEVS